MASGRRHTPTLKISVPQVESLKNLSDGMTSIGKSSFKANYGLILDLLHEEVDPMAIITLGQFYDPPLRCFTFQDFQLAPTLEEFAKILGCDLKDCGPYLGLGENPTMEDIAKSLYLPCKEVSSWLETRKDDKKNDIKGFSRSVLETKAQALLAKKDWKPFNAVLALLVYGLVLFPNKENFVDFSAIGVFIAKNPVSALLADFYHSLYIRHEKRKGTISCCVPLVQKWLMSHLPKKGAFVENPASSKWSHRMMALTEKDISWYSRSLDGTEIILSCGDFPNVPLMGTKGCINYNPVLALRQLGYPMKGKPDDHLLKEFILKEGEEDPALLRRIRRAWNQVHKKALCKKNCIANPLYTQWVRERVAINQLPFDMVVKPSSPEPITVVPVEEVEELKVKVEELQKKNEEWEMKYLQAEGEIARLKREQAYKEEVLQGSRKRIRESKVKREKIMEGMLSAGSDLIAKNEEIERIKRSSQEVEKFGRLAMEAQKKWRLKHQEQVKKTQEVKEQLRLERAKSQDFEQLHHQERIRREYIQAGIEDTKKRLHSESIRKQEFESLYLQEKMRSEHLQAEIEGILDQHVEIYQNQVARLSEEIEEMNMKLIQRERVLELVWNDSDRWRNDFARMAAFSNLAIEELPEMLGKAEAAMRFYKVPQDVKEFTDYCKEIMVYYKGELAKAKKSFV